MKNLVIAFLLIFVSINSYAQSDTTTVQDSTLYRIVKSDGHSLMGYILKQDAREVLFRTNDGREIIIPQHVIKEIVPISSEEFNKNGQYIGEDRFATRYFITTNGLPIKKGEHYIQWNLFGPDVQFGLGKNLGVGVMTSWFGIPIIGTIKKSWEIGEKTQFAIGGLVGTGAWVAPDWGGALPFATLSFGNRRNNIAFSGGYGAIWADGDLAGRTLTSVAGMVRVAPNFSLVFDSFIFLPGAPETRTETVWNSDGTYYDQQVTYRDPAFAIFTPGMRWQFDEKRAFQIGFSGVLARGSLWPVPIPMVQWYRSIK